MTSAKIVTPGQASATAPVMIARTPRRINEVDVDLNMTGIPFGRGGLTPCRNHPPGTSLFASVGSLAETPASPRTRLAAGGGGGITPVRDNSTILPNGPGSRPGAGHMAGPSPGAWLSSKSPRCPQPTPRLSPVEPYVLDGDLWLSMMWQSAKARPACGLSVVVAGISSAFPVGC